MDVPEKAVIIWKYYLLVAVVHRPSSILYFVTRNLISMKISWGYKIVIAYLLFVGGILFLVLKASGINIDLVRSDYYEAELQYQQVIDEKSRAAALSVPVRIELKSGEIWVNFPKEMQGHQLAGEIYLYCPAEAKRDVRRNFNITDTVYRLPIPGSAKGMYDVKLSWQRGSERYFHEQKLFF
jgi:nitrogen fixation protein FixH